MDRRHRTRAPRTMTQNPGSVRANVGGVPPTGALTETVRNLYPVKTLVLVESLTTRWCLPSRGRENSSDPSTKDDLQPTTSTLPTITPLDIPRLTTVESSFFGKTSPTRKGRRGWSLVVYPVLLRTHPAGTIRSRRAERSPGKHRGTSRHVRNEDREQEMLTRHGEGMWTAKGHPVRTQSKTLVSLWRNGGRVRHGPGPLFPSRYRTFRGLLSREDRDSPDKRE